MTIYRRTYRYIPTAIGKIMISWNSAIAPWVAVGTDLRLKAHSRRELFGKIRLEIAKRTIPGVATVHERVEPKYPIDLNVITDAILKLAKSSSSMMDEAVIEGIANVLGVKVPDEKNKIP